MNTSVYPKDATSQFHIAAFSLAFGDAVLPFSSSAAEMLARLAGDTAWLLQNGDALPPSGLRAAHVRSILFRLLFASL